jgi:NAD(P)-dependent dehydrogenase (short-subunit alcohol dehydrogenase family)
MDLELGGRRALITGTGVTVNALLPGPTRTESTERLRADGGVVNQIM